jgi:hypothetical protein
MRAVHDLLQRREERFCRHPFFSILGDAASVDEVLPFASGVAFWALAFQDLLRLNEGMVRDPYLRKIARHHRVEDTGHDLWLLGDLRKLGVDHVDVAWLFSEQNSATRLASYALLSEVFRAPTDVCRIVLLLTVESSGSVFFQRIARFMEARTNLTTLQYFSRSHLEVEAAHQMWENRIQTEIFGREVAAVERQAALDVVSRAYDAFEAMFDGIVARIQGQRAPRAHVA